MTCVFSTRNGSSLMAIVRPANRTSDALPNRSRSFNQRHVLWLPR